MIEIKSNGLKTQVFIDGTEIIGIREISFEASLHEVPKLNIELIPIPDDEEGGKE